MEQDETTALREELTERIVREFGEERAAANDDAVEFMAQSLLRVYRLEAELFAALEPDGA